MSVGNSTALDLGIVALPTLSGLQDVSSMPVVIEKFGNVLEAILTYASGVTESTTSTVQGLPQYLTWSTVLNIILLSLVIANSKCLPFVYHLRILNGVRHMLRSQRPTSIGPEQLFQPLITSSRAPLMEIDVYGHKNNNTYFTDHDIARTHLLSTLFAKGIENARGGSVTMNGLSGKKRSSFTIPLGAVCCSFRKELKPYEPYDMWTRILSWDEKWFYVVTHFVKKGAKIEPEEMTLYPRQNSLSGHSKSSRQSSVTSVGTPRGSVDGGNPQSANGAIAASAMSKVVFKNGRITISPEVMLEASGLLPPKNATTKHYNELVGAQLAANEAEVSPVEAVHTLDKIESCDSDSGTDSGYASSGSGSPHCDRDQLTREDIEAERLRGLRLAKMLAGQTELESELRHDVALGRHYDGHGAEGVVATLMQLGKLSNYQLL